MTDDFDIADDPVDPLKHYRKRADRKRLGSCFQVRLDPEWTQKMEAFMLKKGMNRNQALKHIIEEFFKSEI